MPIARPPTWNPSPNRHGVEVTEQPAHNKASVTFRLEEGREDEVIAERGRLSDLVIAARPTADGDAKEEVVAESVLMESGSGLLLVPSGSVSDLSGNAAIAWNGSAEAARAVHRAMPLLQKAEEVAIHAHQRKGPCVAPDPDALASYLALHDIHVATCTTCRPTGRTSATRLLQIAHQEEAAFLVMGAFSQGKLRQLILGGATRFMLNRSDLPVLFTH